MVWKWAERSHLLDKAATAFKGLEGTIEPLSQAMLATVYSSVGEVEERANARAALGDPRELRAIARARVETSTGLARTFLDQSENPRAKDNARLLFFRSAILRMVELVSVLLAMTELFSEVGDEETIDFLADTFRRTRETATLNGIYEREFRGAKESRRSEVIEESEYLDGVQEELKADFERVGFLVEQYASQE